MSESTPKNNYAYWVSYNWARASSTGFGGGRIFTTAKAGSLAWTESVRHCIEDQHSFQTVIIINWKRLKDDESWDKGEQSRATMRFLCPVCRKAAASSDDANLCCAYDIPAEAAKGERNGRND